MHTVLQSRSKTVTIGHDQPFCVIGERINPTGRKAFAEELRGGDLSPVVVDVQRQVAACADMLDVNAGIPLVDEAELLAKMLELIQQHTDLPLCIDSSVVEALEAGLTVYEGKALVNSVTVVRELGLDRYPELRDDYFGHYRRVIWLAQRRTVATEAAARRAVARLGLPLEVREVGDPGLERELEPLLPVSA